MERRTTMEGVKDALGIIIVLVFAALVFSFGCAGGNGTEPTCPAGSNAWEIVVLNGWTGDTIEVRHECFRTDTTYTFPFSVGRQYEG